MKKNIYAFLFLTVFGLLPFQTTVFAQTNINTSNTQLMQVILEQIQHAINSIQVSNNAPNWTTPTTNSTSTISSNTTCSPVITDLRLGDSGNEVTNLSKILIAAGTLSQQKNIFDDVVFQAVVAYQEKYASNILAPVGLSRGTGFVGPATRSYMNAHLNCSTNSSSSTTVINTNPTIPPANTPSNVGTGSGNAVTTPSSGSVKILVLARNPNNPDTISTQVPTSDFIISPKNAIFLYGSIVDEYDGWAKISANGVDYPVAGPGSSIVINGQTFSPCTSCQNHDSTNLFHVVVPSLPVTNGSEVSLKLYKSDTTKQPFVVPQTFKYYSSRQIPASDPYILPDASPNQDYSQLLVPKIGSGSVSWIPHLISGVLPRGFDINSTSVTYEPDSVYAKPNIGDIGLFIMWGTVDGQDVAQKFKFSVKSDTATAPVIYSISPATLTPANIASGIDITITGQNFSATNAKVEFRSSGGIVIPATNFSVISPTTIKARVPANLSLGSYQVNVTINSLIATPQNGDPTKQTLNITDSGSATGAYASLTANGMSGSITVNVGNTINYVWSGSNANTATSAFTSAGDTCGWGTKPWVATTVNGSKTDTVQSCQRGGIYVITFQVKNSQTGATAQSSLMVKVNP